MPESRDRLVRPLDVDALFARRRSGSLGILHENPEANNLFGSPTRRWPALGPLGEFSPRRGPGLRTPRSVIGRTQSVFRTPDLRSENTPPGGIVSRARGRVGNSVLPSWYPRTPLRDISAIVRAIEMSRIRVMDAEADETEDPLPEDAMPTSESVAPREHVIALATPSTMKKQTKFSAKKMSKTLLKFSTVSAEESDFITPQKKLLNSIETVEKILLEDLERMKRTPSAKRAEREKKVRTLMSMR